LKIEIVKEGVVYRNPNPGYSYRFASHPHALQLSANELVCAFQRGEAMYAPDLEFVFSRSTDGGDTWHEEAILTRPESDGIPYSYHDPFLSRHGSTLVIGAYRDDRSDAEHPLFNEETGGIFPGENFLMRSEDNGRTWSEPQAIQLPGEGVFTPSGVITETSDGRWFWLFDRWHSYHESGPYRPQMVGFFSDDNGLTWVDPVIVADCKQGKGFWHGKTMRLHDGRWFSLFWSTELGSLSTLTLHRNFGSPDAREWSTPEPTNVPGQTHWPVELDDGTLAMIYTNRESSQPGFFTTLSQDGGLNWDLENQVCVWDATGRDKLGVVSLEDYPRSHDSVAFGAPTLMRLENGDLLAVYWCTEMSITHIRYTRLRIRD
jgi:hypothetical protein